MARQVLDLSTLSWRMGPAPRQPFGALPRDDRRAVRAWRSARVPGAVRADLAAAGLLPAVETPEGIAAGGWVDALDWWYVADLPAAVAAGQQAVLEADGIDDQCAVWLDDRLLAVHAGMFARQAIVLSPWINVPGPHVLAIRIWGAGSLVRLPASPLRDLVRRGLRLTGTNTEYYPDRMATPHSQFSFGWDFAPRVFGTGIWDDIRLVICRGTYMEDVQVIAEPLTNEDPVPVRWRLRLALRVGDVPPTAAEVEVAQGDGLPHTVDMRVDLRGLRRSYASHDLEGLRARHHVDLTVDTPPLRRWWPWDQGEPHLCRVTVRLLDADGEALDEISVTTGVRTVRRERLADGSPWRFVVNDRPVFLRGANWTPVDLLPGTVTPVDYARLLGMAKEAGINFLRVWGGGVRERAAFWHECDRLGILAWQEFPLACAFLDHHPRTPAYLSALADEARGIVRLLRNHPSLLAWCGGNEINPDRERLPLNAIGNVLIEEDAGRPWIPASPSDGDVHQWDVWHGYAPWAELQEQDSPFMSEFGMQALPDAATVAEMFPHGAPRSLDDERWAARKAQAGKLRHYSDRATGSHRLPLQSLPAETHALPSPQGDSAAAAAVSTARNKTDTDLAAIELTQRVQAAALQTGIEACRIRREGGNATGRRPCGGVAFWQFNEPWRAVSWSVVDRAGRPKMAYTMLQRSHRPLLIAAQFPRQHYAAGDTFEADLWLVNDLPAGASILVRARAEAWLDDRRVWEADVEITPARAGHLGSVRVPLTAAPHTLTLRLVPIRKSLGPVSDRAPAATVRDRPEQFSDTLLVHGDTAIADNRYDLRLPLPGPRPAASRLMRWLADHLLGA